MDCSLRVKDFSKSSRQNTTRQCKAGHSGAKLRTRPCPASRPAGFFAPAKGIELRTQPRPGEPGAGFLRGWRSVGEIEKVKIALVGTAEFSRKIAPYDDPSCKLDAMAKLQAA